jgi:H+-transporting ATPase
MHVDFTTLLWTKIRRDIKNGSTVMVKTETEKPGSKDDLKSVTMPELQKKLGSSPDGLSQAEAQKRLTQYGSNEIAEKKTNPFLESLTYFWGPIRG